MSRGSMPVVLPLLTEGHAPTIDLSDGYPPDPYPEVPERVEQVREGLARVWALDVQPTEALALDAVRALHDSDYVDFLAGLNDELGADEEYLPSAFRPDLSGLPVRYQGGMFCTETGTPARKGTYKAALNSAAAAEKAARLVADGANAAVALCRPPGHHAGRRRYGGYCFFNNAYVAAGVLAEHGQVAVLDVDYHLGDGALEFAHPGAPYFSLHAEPHLNYPHMDRSMPAQPPHSALYTLPDGVDGEGYMSILAQALDAIRDLKPDYLVLSLGFDTVGSDHIQDADVNLVPADYARIGEAVRELGAKTVVLQEGGYDLVALADCAEAFAQGFDR